MSAARRLVERAPRVPRMGGEDQTVQDGLSFLDVPEPVVVTVHHQSREAIVVARRQQVYVRWFDDHGVPHLGWLPESAVQAS